MFSVMLRQDDVLSDHCKTIFRNDGRWEIVKPGDGTSGLEIVLVTGARDWEDVDMVATELVELRPKRIIQGGAPGADRIAKTKGEAMGIPVDTKYAHWGLHGDSAGPRRNLEMLNAILGQRALVLAFHDDLNNSKGTKDMVKKARAARVPVKLVGHWRADSGLKPWM